MDPINIASFVIAIFGAILGIRAEFARFNDDHKKLQVAFGKAMMGLRPVLREIQQLPFREPKDVNVADLALAAPTLDTIETKLRDCIPDILASFPHLYGSAEEIIQGIDGFRSIGTSNAIPEEMVACQAGEALYGGARSLVLFEEYRGFMLETDKQPDFFNNPLHQEFRRRQQAFGHERIALEYRQRDV